MSHLQYYFVDHLHHAGQCAFFLFLLWQWEIFLPHLFTVFSFISPLSMLFHLVGMIRQDKSSTINHKLKFLSTTISLCVCLYSLLTSLCGWDRGCVSFSVCLLCHLCNVQRNEIRHWSCSFTSPLAIDSLSFIFPFGAWNTSFTCEPAKDVPLDVLCHQNADSDT